jgi:hypothetical protein
MEDAEGMGGLESVGDLDSNGEDKLGSCRSAGDELIEGLARHGLHDDVSLVAGFAHFVNGADVGVLDGGGEASLAENSGTELLGGEQSGAQDLENDRALEKRVVGKVHHSTAAGAEAAHDLVVLDGFALHY